MRKQWGWDGFIVSDCGALEDDDMRRLVSGNGPDMAAAELKGGTDLECSGHLPQFAGQALAQNKLNISDIDTSISRKFAHWIALGELDGPADVVYQRLGPEEVDTTEHRLLSLSVAEQVSQNHARRKDTYTGVPSFTRSSFAQAMTLLKNDPPSSMGETAASALLPLSGSEKIAMIGPHANFTLQMLSNYAGQNTLALRHSPLMAAQAAGLHVPWTAGHDLDVTDPDKSHIPAAVTAAKAADVAVVVVGGCADHCVGTGRTKGGSEDEGYDRGRIGLPGAQEQMLEAVVAAQPKTIMVMINGGPLSVSWAKDHVPAILEAYYPGQLGGDAIVNTLIGKNNPGGKTPTTWYDDSILSRSMYDMNLNSGDGLTHMYYSKAPLWPFGFGLSYTTFSYSWKTGADASATAAVLSTEDLANSGLEMQCTVTNTGKLSGDAVVLGFVNSTSPDFPRQRLFDFERVTVAPGAEKTVVLTADAEDLSVVDAHGRRWLRGGRFTLRAGDVMAPARRDVAVHGAARLLEDLSGAF